MRSSSAQAKGVRSARPSRHVQQRGVAIISALLVVALSAIIVSGLLWREQVQVRRIENQRLLAQAQWISRSALDWTRLILRSEADSAPTVTYLGGVWGVPIAKTRLSDFLGQIGDVRAQQGASTYLSGSIEDAQAKSRLVHLQDAPASMRFLSLEPLLGPLGQLDLAGIDWVIVGGESGPGARQMQIEWARQVRDQCVRQGVAFFFKQWGGTRPKIGGRALDDREWNEFPEHLALKPVAAE